MLSVATRRATDIVARATESPTQLESIPTNNDLINRPASFTSAPMTDEGNAENVLKMGHTFRYVPEIDDYAWWSKARREWELRSRNEVKQLAIRAARKRREVADLIQVNGDDEGGAKARNKKEQIKFALLSENQSKVNATLEALSSRPALTSSINEWDSNPMTAGIRGGMVADFNAGKIRPAQPADMISKRLGSGPPKPWRGTRWEKFMQEISVTADGEFDQELMKFRQKWDGYRATGVTTEQVMLIEIGDGANGKSIRENTIAAALGDYSMSCPFNTFDSERRSENTNDLARLRGARSVSIMETNERYMDEARVKQMVSSDTVTARFLNKEFFEYRPTGKITMTSNYAPRIRQAGHGIERRILVDPYYARFEGDNQDKDLESKLRMEVEAGHVLDWILEGVQLWRKEGLNPIPEAIRKATREHFEDCDVVGQWIAEELTQVEGEKTWSLAAYASYKKWCEIRSIRPLNSSNFGKQLTARGVKGRRSTGGRTVYDNWRLNPSPEPDPYVQAE